MQDLSATQMKASAFISIFGNLGNLGKIFISHEARKILTNAAHAAVRCVVSVFNFLLFIHI